MVVTAHDIELNVIHTPGVELQLADALFREDTDMKFANIVNSSIDIESAKRVHPIDDLFNPISLNATMLPCPLHCMRGYSSETLLRSA